MKLIHISDLHIGKKIKNFSMEEEQKDMIGQVLRIVKSEKPDAVLIAGDVYDKTQPSEKAVEMFDDFVVGLSRTGSKVFIISGNHDSAERVAFLNRLVAAAGIYLSPVYDGRIEPVPLEDEHGIVNIYMLPFVKPIHVKHAFRDDADEIDNYTDAVSVAIKNMNVDPSQRNVLVSHQFVTGSSRTDSEVSVGGLDNVDASAYDVFDYVALGHIHRPQNINGGKLRYSGTPLKYSFSESNDEKSVTVINMGAKGDVQISTIPIVPLHDFLRVEGQFDEIIAEYEDKDVKDYVEVTLTDEDDITDAFRKLQGMIFPNLMVLRYKNKRTSEDQSISGDLDTTKMTDIEIVQGLFRTMNNQDMSDVQQQYMEDIIKRVTGGDR